MGREPAAIVAGIVAVLDAIIALVAYAASWDGETTALIMGVVTAAAALVGGFVTRSKVTPA